MSACEEILQICADDIIEDADNLGRTALHLAAIGGYGEIVDLLLNRGGENSIDLQFLEFNCIYFVTESINVLGNHFSFSFTRHL